MGAPSLFGASPDAGFLSWLTNSIFVSAIVVLAILAFARRAVRNEIERNNGNVRVGNQLCGDPARGEYKRLRVVYRCGDSEAVRVIARENEVLRLSCRD